MPFPNIETLYLVAVYYSYTTDQTQLCIGWFGERGLEGVPRPGESVHQLPSHQTNAMTGLDRRYSDDTADIITFSYHVAIM